MWSEKHRPRRVSAMVGNEEARFKFLVWLKKWKPGGKAALLVGPPGTGKTTLVELVAKEEGLNLVELNASDTRKKDQLERRIGEAVMSESLFGEGSLIFLDEVDGLAGRADYGAIDFIKESVKGSKNPVVMAANDPESEQVRKLSDVSVAIRFKPPAPREVELYLRRVASVEGREASDSEYESVVKSASGDLRYALNSFQSQGQRGYKDSELTSVESINGFFEAPDRERALRALRAYPKQPRDKLRELHTSVLKSKLPEAEKARALEVLSRADIVMGRIMSGKDWRLLRYLDSMLASELRDAVAGKGLQWSLESVPWNLQVRIWNDSRKMKELAAAYGARVLQGRRSATVQDVPYILAMCSSKRFRGELMKSLSLDEGYEKLLDREGAKVKN
jgi:replication factor C large subunit